MEPSKIELLELDIDIRMRDIWKLAAENGREDDLSASLMRAAYGKGYVDALKDKGSLCDEHGYRKG